MKIRIYTVAVAYKDTDDPDKILDDIIAEADGAGHNCEIAYKEILTRLTSHVDVQYPKGRDFRYGEVAPAVDRWHRVAAKAATDELRRLN